MCVREGDEGKVVVSLDEQVHTVFQGNKKKTKKQQITFAISSRQARAHIALGAGAHETVAQEGAEGRVTRHATGGSQERVGNIHCVFTAKDTLV